MKLPKGYAGQWFAEWEGERLPCIHQHAIEKGRYIDRGIDDHRAWPSFIAGLRELRRAIVTTSHPLGPDGIRRRKSYVGIWEIGEVQVSADTLSFDIGVPLMRFRG